MAVSTITITHPSRPSPLFGAGKSKRVKLRGLATLCRAVAGGEVRSPAGTPTRALIGKTAATGTITLASASGIVGPVINGVPITVMWATSDTATAAALAAAINASVDPLVSGVVAATSAGGVVTIISLATGKMGNAITLAALGVNTTASGNRLTGGTQDSVFF